MKKIISIMILLAMCISLCACGGKQAEESAPAAEPEKPETVVEKAEEAEKKEEPVEVKYFKLGTANGLDSPQQKVAEAMNELLAERLPQYQIEIFPNGQLGGERDLIESVQMGSLDMAVTATTPLANFVPSLGAGELLYLIKDYDHADAVYQGEIGKQWLEDCAAANIKGLGFAEVGFRHFCTGDVEVSEIADTDGLKLRVMENQLHVAGWRVLDVDAITMGWADAYAGIQQGTIDALENPWCLIMANNVYEVCKYVAETNHIYTAQCFMMSTSAWDSLSAEEQVIWQECASEACQAAIDFNRSNTDSCREKAIELGVTVTTPDVSEWQEMAKTLYEEYDEQFGDTIRAIQALEG